MTPAQQTETAKLTKLDRCDRCEAQAMTVAKKNESILLFCGHHSKEHIDKLMTDGWSFF